MRISEIAASAGVGVETVRFYESKGLISQPPRPEGGGNRNYSPEVAHRIGFIRSAQELGFSLREIDELLALESGPDAQCLEIRTRAEVKLQEVKTKIEKLAEIKSALEALIAACPGKGLAQACSILGEIKRGELHLGSAKKGNCYGEETAQDRNLQCRLRRL